MTGTNGKGVANRGPPHDKMLEELVGQLMRNVLSGPQNIGILVEFLALPGSYKSPSQTGGSNQRGQPRGSQLRDVSSNEIIRPREPPAVIGLSHVNYLKLMK